MYKSLSISNFENILKDITSPYKTSCPIKLIKTQTHRRFSSDTPFIPFENERDGLGRLIKETSQKQKSEKVYSKTPELVKKK